MPVWCYALTALHCILIFLYYPLTELVCMLRDECHFFYYCPLKNKIMGKSNGINTEASHATIMPPIDRIRANHIEWITFRRVERKWQRPRDEAIGM